ncbi:ABC transporter permease [Aquimarina sp. TRL1]|uniref:ABC transporter permease n=1 Tax=Aquimarina sp. (strain TRL1) TaxID=2736252 RepID=UPI0020CB0F55|nr:ABC transporter permease [Aquimarina sp. TRL1]
MIRLWCKLFYRQSKKHWLHLIINNLGLTLGITSLIMVLLYFNNEKSYDQWNPNKDTIYKVSHKMFNGEYFDTTTVPEGPVSTEVIPEISAFVSTKTEYSKDVITYNDISIFQGKMLEVDSNFFDFFPHPILKGNPEEILKANNSVVISSSVEKKLFGNASSYGKTIKVGNKEYIVTGVYELQRPSIIEPQVLFKKEIDNRLWWGNYNRYTFYRVKEGTDIPALEKKMFQVFEENYFRKEAKELGISVQEYVDIQGAIPFVESLESVRLFTKGDGSLEGKGNYPLLVSMLILSILIIAISCVNFINLSIATAVFRAKEVGIQKSNGVSKGQIITQYFLEIGIQCLLSFFLALVLVELIVPHFNDFIGKELAITSGGVVFRVFLIVIALIGGIGSIIGGYIANFDINKVLKGNFSRSKRMIIMRNGMLGLQFVISGFFLIGSLVMYAQLKYMNEKDTGFSGEQIITVAFNNPEGNYWEQYQLIKQELEKHPGIITIGASSVSPGLTQNFTLDMDYLGKVVEVTGIPTDFGYFDMMGVAMASGRDFSATFSSDSLNTIIFNKTAIKALGIKDPIQKKINLIGKELTIIGVVNDYHIKGYDKKIAPAFYVHFNTIEWFNETFETVHFKIKEREMYKTIADIEQFWNEEIETSYPFTYAFMDKQFKKTFEKYEQQKIIFLSLTLIVIIISLLGLFALSTLTIQQRYKEIAIRKTLGATTLVIMKQLFKDFFRITVMASFILLPLAFYSTSLWLDNFIYKIDMPVWPYLLTPFLLLLLVFMVVGVKSYKATKVDLIKYLKFE